MLDASGQRIIMAEQTRTTHLNSEKSILACIPRGTRTDHIQSKSRSKPMHSCHDGDGHREGTAIVFGIRRYDHGRGRPVEQHRRLCRKSLGLIIPSPLEKMSTASLVWYQIDAQFNSVAKSLGKEEKMTSTGTSFDFSESKCE